MALTDDTLLAAMQGLLLETDFPELGHKYSGKVRDGYASSDGRRVLITTDRISAFDRVLGAMPLKGQLLNAAAVWWFRKTAPLVKNHLLDVPDPNVLLVQHCTPLPVEMVVRGYLTGTTSTSIWVHYARGERLYCGHSLPDGLRQHEKLPAPLLTPSTKAEHGHHDVAASRREILEITGMPAHDFDVAADMAMTLFAEGTRLCAQRGLILVDTKYEFGKTPGGEIVLIDEVHTPDSSRFWFAGTYDDRVRAGAAPESFDKEFVRRYLAERSFHGEGPLPEIPKAIWMEATRRYATAVETILGEPFEPNLEAPLPRIRKNLHLGGQR